MQNQIPHLWRPSETSEARNFADVIKASIFERTSFSKKKAI